MNISLGQYQEFQLIENPTTTQILSHLGGLSKTQVKRLKEKDADALLKSINDILNEEHPLTNILEIDGKEFGFIPNLDDITFGENLDLNNYLGDWGQMHKAMAVLYRPITSRLKDLYVIEEYEGSFKYSELMKQIPIEVTIGAMLFFYRLMNDLLNCFQKYLNQAVKQPEVKEVLQKNGEIMDNYIKSVKATSDDLKLLLNINFLNV
jgi:hypothetical protein